MRRLIEQFDTRVWGRLRNIEVPLARLALFVVYFWFGALKALDLSPAASLVLELHTRTIPFIPFQSFYGAFAVFEMAIGFLFLLRGMERVALLMVAAHLAMTALPLVILTDTTWQGFLAPTLEGQYIIKNVLIAALAVVVGAHARNAAHNGRTAEVL